MVSVCEIVPSFCIPVLYMIQQFCTFQHWKAWVPSLELNDMQLLFLISSVYETLPAVSLLGIASYTLPGCHKNFSEDGGNPHYLFNPSRPLGVMKRCFEVTSCDLIKLISKGTTSQIDEIIGRVLPFGPIHAWNEIQNYSDLVQVDDLDLKLN